MVASTHSYESVSAEEYDLGSPPPALEHKSRVFEQGKSSGHEPNAPVMREISSASSTAYKGRDHAGDSSPAWSSDGHKMWNAIWLRTEVLASFLVLFLALFLVTIMLWHESQVYLGVSVQSAYREYGWRYGPTALLTVVLSFWKQVDYSNRLLVPWAELRRGPATADRSVLIDYISPLVLVVLYRATKNRHWAVTATIVGGLLIQLATIFSTGLFVLEPTTLTQGGASVSIATAFNGSDFTLTNTSSNIGQNPTVLYYGERVQNLPGFAGVDVNRGLIVPDFSLASSLPDGPQNNTNYTATVPGAQSSFECEYLSDITNGTSVYLPWFSILSSFFAVNITTPSCNLSNVIVAEGPDHNFYNQPNATRAYMGYFGDFMCDPTVDYSLYSEELPQPANTTFDHRIVMSMVDLRFSKQNMSYNNPPVFYVNQLTVAICKASYTMGNYSVTYTNSTADGNSMTANLVSNSSSEIPGFPSTLLGAAVSESLTSTYLGTGGQDYVLTKQVETFYQVLSAMNGNVSIGLFMDPAKLISSGTEAFTGIATQLIHDYMLSSSNATSDASVVFSQNRLWVRTLSVGFMAAIFLLLSGISAALLFIRPWDVVPSDPGSIGATALILAESSYLRSLLSGLGAAGATDIRHRVLPYHFRSTLTPGLHSTFAVEPVEYGQAMADKKGPEEISTPRANQWWTPPAVKIWFYIVAIVISVILIAVLEVIQRISDRNNGFIDVASTQYGFATTHALATYVPSLVAFIVVSLFHGMRLAVCILVPWLALHRGSATASRSLFFNLTKRLSVHRIWLAIKDGNIGTVLILVAGFLAAWLPILVSGLYETVSVSVPQALSASQGDVFDFNLKNIFEDDENAGTITGLIAENSLAYPAWTYGDLAFNTLNVSNLTDPIPTGSEVPFTAKLQATRPSLNCSVIPSDLFTYQWDPSANEEEDIPAAYAAMNMTGIMPWMCEKQIKTSDQLPWFQGYVVPKDGKPVYFGAGSILEWTNISVYGNKAVDTNDNQAEATELTAEGLENYVGGYGCPSFSVTLGRASTVKDFNKKKNTTSYAFDVDATTIVCYQNMEVVDANVTLTLPNLGVISSDMPPVTDESTAQYLVNELPYYTGSIFEIPFNNLLLTLTYGTGNITLKPLDGVETSNDDLDYFTTVMATTNASLPIEWLIGANNTQNLIDATSRLYKIYMPQAISRNFRNTNLDAQVSTPSSSSGTVTTAKMATTVEVPGRLRLKQQAAPKLAMQVLLAAMVVCAAASRMLLRDMGEIVPHNPCSIAGRAAMFADGDVSTRELVPLGAEWQSESELRANGVYGGWLFSLGWWESSGVYKYGVDVGWIDNGDSQEKK
ncbi:hypothetical protein F5Y16DRAFT_390811 [Xylariaceae sp. FL0255]|nr:hypothetical protein F5Y16DRAFT_390811 [Xylariaceae sp. FL0255]